MERRLTEELKLLYADYIMENYIDKYGSVVIAFDDLVECITGSHMVMTPQGNMLVVEIANQYHFLCDLVPLLLTD